MGITPTTVIAFVDEYGDANLAVEKQGATTYFIITAVLVAADSLQKQLHSAKVIQADFFQKGEMKSSGVGGNDDRRRRLLEAINQLEIKTYSLAVDKRELEKTSGLAWKGSFFKYLNRRLYERLYRAFGNTHIVADEHGTEQFMKGFEAYIERQIRPDLFAERSFQFAASNSEVFLQIADVVSGTLARFFDPKKQSDQAAEFLRLVSEMSVGIEVWPPKRLPPPRQFLEDSSISNPLDGVVRAHCLRRAQAFVADEIDTEEEAARAQVELVTYLLFQAEYVDESAFISTGQILEYLAQHASLNLTEHQFRSTVISRLRDAEVIIASSNRGYKIPTRVSDIQEFVAHANAIIPPMLRRLTQARNDLRLATSGELDILSSVDYLRRLADTDL